MGEVSFILSGDDILSVEVLVAVHPSESLVDKMSELLVVLDVEFCVGSHSFDVLVSVLAGLVSVSDKLRFFRFFEGDVSGSERLVVKFVRVFKSGFVFFDDFS